MSRRERIGILAILCVAAAGAMLVQGVSDNQASHLALVRALSSGTTEIDRHAATTDDKVEHEGHFHSNKAPGVALVMLPAYEALDAAGVPEASRRAAERRGDPQRDEDRGTAWALGLAAALLPALALMLVVRRLADRVESGYGTAAAVTLGLATLLLPFSTLLFSHALSALLGFAAFAVLWIDRDRGGRSASAGRVAPLACAGLLAGLAITTEYTLGIVAVVLAAFALAGAATLRRAGAYAAGVALGVAPLLAYNALAFDSPFHVSYSGVEAQSAGLFGVRLPRPEVALDLLFGARGLLLLSPVLVAAALGVVLMARRGRRAEALTIAGIAGGLLLANAGFYLDDGAPGASDHPFGGFSPGPRLLVPALPFLAVGLAPAYRRLPRLTFALAAASGVCMVAATVTEPLVSGTTSIWWDRLADGDFTATVLTELGVGSGWLAVAPVLAAAIAGATLAVLASRRPAAEPAASA